MKYATLTSLIAVTSVLSAIACAPIDNEIASRQSSVAGAGGGVDETGVGGSAIGGAGGRSDDNVGGTPHSTPVTFGGTGGVKTGCEDYRDATTADHGVVIVVKNERSTPVYIGNAVAEDGLHGLMDLYDASETSLMFNYDRSFDCTCDGVLAHGYAGCKLSGYPARPMRRIDANSETTLTWDGLVGVKRDIRAACLFAGETLTTCTQVTAAAAGTYKVQVLGSTGYECLNNGQPVPCDCLDTNSCDPYASNQGKGELLQAVTQFDLASSTTVTVRFTE